MEEEWRPIQHCVGYEVSNFGRVRSVPRMILQKTRYGGEMYRHLDGKIIIPFESFGYLRVNLSRYGKFMVHRLVAEAFVPNPCCLPQINHIDENKANNVPENLEWCTCQYNVTYGSRIIKSLESRNRNDPEHAWAKKIRDTRIKNGSYKRVGELLRARGGRGVRQIDGEGNIIKEWSSVSFAAESCGTSSGKICSVCRGVRKSAAGYKWEYL